MNGKKKKNKKLVLDSGRVSQSLRRDLGLKSLNMKRFFTLKLHIYLHFKKKLIRNESQVEDSFQI